MNPAQPSLPITADGEVAIAAVILISAPSATSGPGSDQTTARDAADPLVGTWDTGPFPTGKLRTGLLAHGYTTSEVDTFSKNLGLGKVQEFNLAFYRQNGVPFQVQTGWDPSQGSKPSDGDHGPYTLLGHRRFTVSGVDPTNKIHRSPDQLGRHSRIRGRADDTPKDSRMTAHSADGHSARRTAGRTLRPPRGAAGGPLRKASLDPATPATALSAHVRKACICRPFQ
jgi:hypothetical protein